MFANAILSTKTLTDKGKIEILIGVASFWSEGSWECKLFDFSEKV